MGTASSGQKIAVIGGGAAGYFAALTYAERAPGSRITIYEAGKEPLSKVRISGGGRCNVTHSCFDPSELVKSYPRGANELRGPFTRFQPRDMIQWLEARGVALKTEEDGRVFPVSDDSSTIIDCFEHTRKLLKVTLESRSKVRSVQRLENHGFCINFGSGQSSDVDMVVIATGSASFGYDVASSLGHEVVERVPALFTFKVDDKSLTQLSGVSVEHASVTMEIRGRTYRQKGPILATHWGMSGPAIIKLSSMAARDLFNSDYMADIVVNWMDGTTVESVATKLRELRESSPRVQLKRKPFPLPQRVWDRFLELEEIVSERSFSSLSNGEIFRIAERVCREPIQISGKGEFKEEFVTCGGVALKEIDFRTMESKKVPGVFFVGEVLDIDGITGGFNFQSAWTTGWIAGVELAKRALPGEGN